jgi:hypothetical protein
MTNGKEGEEVLRVGFVAVYICTVESQTAESLVELGIICIIRVREYENKKLESES